MVRTFERTRPLGLAALALVCLLTVSACGGGGGGSSGTPPPAGAPDPGTAPPPINDPPPEEPPPEEPATEEPPTEEPPSTRQYRAAGDFATMDDCSPIQGDAAAPFKIVFININDADFFDAIVSQAREQLDVVAPFNDDRLRTAIYTLDVTAGEAALGCDEHGFLDCNADLLNAALADQCQVDDPWGVIKVGVVESQYGSRGGEIIYLGLTHSDEVVALDLLHNTFVHELAHNFGLADLYPGLLYFDGRSDGSWAKDFTRNFLNVDGPGCPNWCNSFKPASEYIDSPTAICPTFDTREQCVTYNRDETGDCPITDEDSNYVCCVWDDEAPFEYFDSQCAPWWGTEDIGRDCLAGSGCYFGADLGQYAWRPVLAGRDSLMLSTQAGAFSSVELRELDRIVDCCLTATDADPLCQDFRREYADFLFDSNFKHRIGSCGVIATDTDRPIFDE